jgi:hypothetical protein
MLEEGAGDMEGFEGWRVVEGRERLRDTLATAQVLQ